MATASRTFRQKGQVSNSYSTIGCSGRGKLATCELSAMRLPNTRPYVG